MKFILLFLLSVPSHSFGRVIDIGDNPATQSNYIVKVSGDFPVYTFELGSLAGIHL
jgi:hypothetical protein